MSEWQPIETAPRDETLILALHPYAWANPELDPPVAVIRWDTRAEKWLFHLPGNYLQIVEIPPTHWHPLPEPPLRA